MVKRDLGADGQVYFFANLSTGDASARLTVPRGGRNLYWYDALTGALWDAGPVEEDSVEENRADMHLGSLESRFLIATDRSLPATAPTLAVLGADLPAMDIGPQQWTVSTGDVVRTSLPAFPDPREDAALMYQPGPLRYSATFIAPPDAGGTILDLGRVEGVATVTLNGAPVGTVSLDPFLIDMTEQIVAGENRLEVSVMPPLRNAMVGRAVSGDPYTVQMKQFETSLTPAGLYGPVRLLHRAPRPTSP